MATQSTAAKSFSAGRRWGILASVTVSILSMTALAVMVNYLSARHYTRWNWSSRTQMQLKPQTIGLLKSITNHVKVIIYYDRESKLYTDVAALLDEYQQANRKISVQTVDYLRDYAGAQKVSATYHLGTSEGKDLVIFDCNGNYKIVPDRLLGEYTYELDEAAGKVHPKLKGFLGESFFNSSLLRVTSEKQGNGYFLTGHGEHDPESDKEMGYSEFRAVLGYNNVKTMALQLTGTNTVPADCDILILAGPRKLGSYEVEQIRQYLAGGGRMLMLFNNHTVFPDGRRQFESGLEPLLSMWGVGTGRGLLRDPKNGASESGLDFFVSDFNRAHPITAGLGGARMLVIQPRAVGKLSSVRETPESPKVEELFYSSAAAYVEGSPVPVGQRLPLAVAVEKSVLKGLSDRGNTRIVVVGDSSCLANAVMELDKSNNQDFADFVVNWLLDRPQMMQGVGPRARVEYRITLTRSELQSVRWLFLGAMPGGVVLLGGLVWLRRRH